MSSDIGFLAFDIAFAVTVLVAAAFIIWEVWSD